MASLVDATNTKKRKSAGVTGRGAKRARTGIAATVDAILAEPESYVLPKEEGAVRQLLVELAEYARNLEGAMAAGGSAGQPKSQEELEDAAEKLRKAAVSGIKKQMKWRDSCKNGTAKWAYDGVCPDPLVFGTLLKLGGPPTWKTKKIPKDEFEDVIGHIVASARYNDMYITSKDVNVHYKEGGEFKFSGTYGR
ncbi:hypothetical protein OE88DRAFT_1652076 [Heliocybe sulcata]|uniref:Uncharacterized protein n=1 Tax=Heliocybe sulcata TaxID=5364 RepID=A0A5C3NPQ5_9AGAM|nr:hypothetical protein OE88DRAFT_1652076 [Heliocybe sulcata]